MLESKRFCDLCGEEVGDKYKRIEIITEEHRRTFDIGSRGKDFDLCIKDYKIVLNHIKKMFPNLTKKEQ